MAKLNRKGKDRRYYARHRKKILLQMSEYRKKNRKRINKRYREWYRRTGKRTKQIYNWRVSYKLSPEQVDTLYKHQKNRCAICKSKRDVGGRWGVLNIDHKGELVRGLLCTFCNRVLGALEKRPEILNLCEPFAHYIKFPPAIEINLQGRLKA